MLEEFKREIMMLGFDVLVALAVLFLGKKIINLIQKLVHKSFEHAKIDLNIRKFLDSLIRLALYTILISVIAALLGIDTTSFIAVLGSAGLAVGLALQGSLSNFAGGVLIIALKPFVVNDYIVTTGVEGKVESIDLFYTTLLTLDNKKTTIPNGTLANSIVTNATGEKIRRLDLKIGIDYRADMKKAKQILEDILENSEKILKDRDKKVYVDALGDQNIMLGLQGWVDGDDLFSEKCEILELIKNKFDEYDIPMASQKLNVHVKSEDGRTLLEGNQI